MNITEFPKSDLETILSQYHSIATATAQDVEFVSSENIPVHHQLITILDATNFITPFDYNTWAETFGWDKVMSAETLLHADFETLRRLITTHVRTNRFVEGHWDDLLQNGYLTEFMRRLQILYNNTYSSN